MPADVSVWAVPGYIFTANGWKYVDEFKFEHLSAREVATLGLSATPGYVRISGLAYKDTDFDGVADDTLGIIRDGGMILDMTTLASLASELTDSYNQSPYHENESFEGDGYATLSYICLFFGEGRRSDTLNYPGLASMIYMPAGAFVEYYDFKKDGAMWVHLCTDRWADTNFSGTLSTFFGDAEPKLEHACGIMIPRDHSGNGVYARAFATAITAYLNSLAPA